MINKTHLKSILTDPNAPKKSPNTRQMAFLQYLVTLKDADYPENSQVLDFNRRAQLCLKDGAIIEGQENVVKQLIKEIRLTCTDQAGHSNINMNETNFYQRAAFDLTLQISPTRTEHSIPKEGRGRRTPSPRSHKKSVRNPNDFLNVLTTQRRLQAEISHIEIKIAEINHFLNAANNRLANQTKHSSTFLAQERCRAMKDEKFILENARWALIENRLYKMPKVRLSKLSEEEKLELLNDANKLLQNRKKRALDFLTTQEEQNRQQKQELLYAIKNINETDYPSSRIILSFKNKSLESFGHSKNNQPSDRSILDFKERAKQCLQSLGSPQRDEAIEKLIHDIAQKANTQRADKETNIGQFYEAASGLSRGNFSSLLTHLKQHQVNSRSEYTIQVGNNFSLQNVLSLLNAELINEGISITCSQLERSKTVNELYLKMPRDSKIFIIPIPGDITLVEKQNSTEKDLSASNELLAALLKYDPNSNKQLKAYGLEFVDAQGKFHLGNFEAACHLAEKEEFLSTPSQLPLSMNEESRSSDKGKQAEKEEDSPDAQYDREASEKLTAMPQPSSYTAGPSSRRTGPIWGKGNQSTLYRGCGQESKPIADQGMLSLEEESRVSDKAASLLLQIKH